MSHHDGEVICLWRPLTGNTMIETLISVLHMRLTRNNRQIRQGVTRSLGVTRYRLSVSERQTKALEKFCFMDSAVRAWIFQIKTALCDKVQFLHFIANSSELSSYVGKVQILHFFLKKEKTSDRVGFKVVAEVTVLEP